ncbi:bifunctional protein GlmU [Methanobrevibacter cuticularis]|uniref:Bifunctional protein GlmU n=1 Tax=Methanobrevibacter cuticularis TaxID=47311 RepID=A0A166CWG0_9EURY|nr:NTP transferase domain-containing protein [Methanobrevibacter cuticularis]KZX17257.1 bifunctional protein GlmU [Methanobrevibacter cuticularis]
MITAVLMAGGQGKRMKSDLEKPLLRLKSKPLIDHVLGNLKDSKYIENIVVATSPHTPKTKKYVDQIILNPQKENRIECIETSGDGYLEDLSFLLSKFEKRSNTDILLFVNSDLPFVSSDILDSIIEKYLNNDNPALSVLVPIAIFKEYGIEPSYIFEDLVPSGVNILISQNIIQNESKLIIPKVELALNINTVDDLNLAIKLYDKFKR